MGRKERTKPERLAEKLRTIRLNGDLTCEQMVERLNCPKISLYRASITEYEKGRREPPALILLAYARFADITVEVLIDDELDLPDE